MTTEEITEILIEAITEVQTGSGRLVPEILHDGLHPIGDFEGFDSINALEVTSLLSDRLGFDIKPNIILPVYPGRQLTIAEIVYRLHRAIGAQGGLST